MNLRIVINQYPQCLESRAKLSAILRDLYPTERREINLILNVYECGIADKISHLHSIDAMQAQIFCRQLEVEYSLSTKAALWGLSLWLEAYQIPLQHNSPAPKHSNRLCPPEKVLSKNPSTLSLLPSRTTCTLDNGVQYELKILTLSTAEIIKYNCFSEKNVVIPSIIEGKKIVGIGKDSFRSHSEIEYVRISEGVRYVNDGAFADCYNLKSFLIPQSLVRLGTEFGSDLENTGVFERTALEHIILPRGIRYIGKRAFNNPRSQYNKMFTLQQASMEAPAPAPDDVPAKPYFSPEPVAEEQTKPEPVKKSAPQPAKPIIGFGGFTPKINTAQSTQASGSKIHKPNNSYTPRPTASTSGSFTPHPANAGFGIGAAKSPFGLNSTPAPQPKPPVKVDVSKIKVGGKVKHKAFGVGTVTAFAKDTISVRFGGMEKKFQFPAALTQGYLSLVDD